MPQFAYRARNAQGGLVEGVLDCPDRAIAIRQIEQKRECFKLGSAPVRGATFLSILRCAWIVANCLVLTACNQVTRDVEGIALSVEGPVMVKHRGAAQEEALGTNARFSEGDLIKTGNSAQACLMLVPGTLIALDSDSTLDVKQLRMTKDGNALVKPMRMRTARLHLVRGAVTALVERSDTPKVFVKVTLQQNEVTGSGGYTFHVASTAERTCVVCVRGELRLEKAGQESMTIAAGYFLELRDSAGVAKPADSDTAAQDYLLQGFEEENKLWFLENQLRFAPAPWRKENLQ